MSCDTSLGVPFNIVQYSLLTHLVAQSVNMVAERFVWVGGDTHIYRGQEKGIAEQMLRKPLDTCATVKLNPDIKNIFDFKYADIKIEDYECHDAIKFPDAAV